MGKDGKITKAAAARIQSSAAKTGRNQDLLEEPNRQPTETRLELRIFTNHLFLFNIPLMEKVGEHCFNGG